MNPCVSRHIGGFKRILAGVFAVIFIYAMVNIGNTGISVASKKNDSDLYNAGVSEEKRSKTFLESLKQYKPYDPVRVRYYALYALVEEFADVADDNSEEQKYFEELKMLDVCVHEDSVRVENICSIVFRNFDPDKMTPQNEFIGDQLTEKVEWILNYSCWHPGSFEPLDELARDVIKLGVPEIDRHEMTFMIVTYPCINFTQGYDRSKFGSWNVTGCSRNRRIRFEKLYHTFYIQTQYEKLEDIAAGFVSFPGRGPNSWDGNAETYGMEPWRWFAGRIDISARVKRLEEKESGGQQIADITVQYTLSRISDKKVICSDSIRYVKNISGDIDKNDELSVQLITDWFHTINPPEPPLSSNEDYLLGVSVTDSHSEKIYQQSFYISLPNDTLTLPEYTIMFIRDSQPEGSAFPINPYRGIPSFSSTSTMRRGDTLNIWFPMTDLPYSPTDNAYCCFVAMYLVRADSKKGRVILSDIKTVWKKNALREYDEDKKQARELIEPIQTEVIRSDQPNLYKTLHFAVPRKINKGKYHLVAYFRSLPDSATGEIEVLGGASKKVVIK